MKAVNSILFMMLIFQACSENISSEDVPAEVKNAFELHFPSATEVQWKEALSSYEASFIMFDKLTSAFFNADGGIEKIESEINIEEIPKLHVAFVDSNYPGYTINKAFQVEYQNKIIHYQVFIIYKNKKYKLVFTEGGELIRRVLVI